MTSSRRLGEKLRAWGLFVIPEESQPPAELEGLVAQNDAEDALPAALLWPQALLCPYVQAVHLSMVRQRTSSRNGAKPASSLANLRERLVQQGAAALQQKEILRLLWDAETVFWLHQELWSRPEAALHSSWKSLQSGSGESDLLRRYLIVE